MNVEVRIDGEARGNWESRGWALIPGFLGPDEIASLRREADRLLQRQDLFDERGTVPFSPTRDDRLEKAAAQQAGYLQ